MDKRVVDTQAIYNIRGVFSVVGRMGVVMRDLPNKERGKLEDAKHLCFTAGRSRHGGSLRSASGGRCRSGCLPCLVPSGRSYIAQCQLHLHRSDRSRIVCESNPHEI
jgi:hypothetical protein